MGGFLTALRSDLYVGLRNRGLHLLLLFPGLASMARIALGRLGTAGEEARSTLMGQAPVEGGELTAYGALADGLSVGMILCSLSLVAIGAHSLAHDREQGVLRHLVIRSVSRSALTLSRFVYINVLGVILVALVLVLSWTAAGILYEFTPVIEDGYELIAEAEMRAELFRGLVLAAIPLPAAIAFGLLLSSCSRSATSAVATAMSATLAFDIFKGLLGPSARYVYAYWPPSLVDQSYLTSAAKLVRGYSDVFIEESAMTLNYAVPLPEAFIFLLASVLVMRMRKI